MNTASLNVVARSNVLPDILGTLLRSRLRESLKRGMCIWNWILRRLEKLPHDLQFLRTTLNKSQCACGVFRLPITRY